jgi:hypothetical protein
MDKKGNGSEEAEKVKSLWHRQHTLFHLKI